MRVLVLEVDPPTALLRALDAGGADAVTRHPPPAAAVGCLLDEVAPGAVLLGPAAADAARAPALVAAIRLRRPGLPVVAVSAGTTADAAVALVKAGCSEWLRLGDASTMLPALLAALPACDEGVLAGLVGRTPAIEHVRALVRTAARADAPVLLEGETGTGKEVVARAIHALGPRAARPFVALNCAAVPESLAESEFFGHARGAFTGALQDRPGALRLADGGTLFLDEIEDLPLALQAKLLRVLQDREVRPLGASAARRVDVRIVAASNRTLAEMVETGSFRRDLFYRLRVLGIVLPPLRARRADVPLLVAHFVAAFNRRHATALRVPPPAALRVLVEHDWPGNVRELENGLEALCIQACARGVDLAGVLRAEHVAGGFWHDERARILRVLDDHRWNRQRAATALGISRVTLWRRMERHGIRDPLGPGRPAGGPPAAEGVAGDAGETW